MRNRLLTIGDVARRFDIRSSALRYYEARGLLRAARTGNGYRAYGEDAVAALRFIRRAQALGITLSEIKDLLRLSGQGRRPCPRVRELARDHLRDIDLKIRKLTALRSQLRHLLRRNPGAPRSDEICPMIQTDGD